MSIGRSIGPISSSRSATTRWRSRPSSWGRDGPTVLHVGYLPATVEEVFFPQAELVGDVGPSLTLLADRLEGKLPRAGALLALRDGILAHIADRAEESRCPLTPQRIVHDVRQAMPEDGDRLPRQRHVQDLVRAQLPHPCRQHAPARQRARHDGRGPALGDHGRHAQSGPPRAGGLRRRRLHDELAGDSRPRCGSSSISSCWCSRTTPTA